MPVLGIFLHLPDFPGIRIHRQHIPEYNVRISVSINELQPILSFSAVDFWYDENHVENKALQNLTFSVRPGERVGLIGGNGAGKSTLLKLPVALLPVRTGTVQTAGMEITDKTIAAVRRRIGYLFQDSESQLFMPTVAKDVAFAAESSGLSREETACRTTAALSLVQMEAMADKQIYRLSGGQKKLTAIAGLLVLKPDLILMDEPSSTLDPKNRRNLIAVLNSLDCAKIIASHDLDFIYDTCDRVLLLHAGKIAADGPAAEILQQKDLLEHCDLELPLRLQR